MLPKCWPAYYRIARRGTGGRVGRRGRGMRKPKRGNVDQVDVFELTIQKEIMDSSRAKPSERIGTLMEPNGDIRHHFQKGGQPKWLTPRVEGNEVGNLEEIT
ncbi:hypothetical protein Tco_0824266 [Tanacetum coccineum]|uniref:Uncharacterized protein n=1 Tax=Tanacetum coccineum TaxID=301880 RepID=A0ABQ5ANA7_9ASTR